MMKQQYVITGTTVLHSAIQEGRLASCAFIALRTHSVSIKKRQRVNRCREVATLSPHYTTCKGPHACHAARPSGDNWVLGWGRFLTRLPIYVTAVALTQNPFGCLAYVYRIGACVAVPVAM